jgi:hypothetical protein
MPPEGSTNNPKSNRKTQSAALHQQKLKKQMMLVKIQADANSS